MVGRAAALLEFGSAMVVCVMLVGVTVGTTGTGGDVSFCSRMFCGVELPLLPPPCGFGGSVDGAVGAGGATHLWIRLHHIASQRSQPSIHVSGRHEVHDRRLIADASSDVRCCGDCNRADRRPAERTSAILPIVHLRTVGNPPSSPTKPQVVPVVHAAPPAVPRIPMYATGVSIFSPPVFDLTCNECERSLNETQQTHICVGVRIVGELFIAIRVAAPRLSSVPSIKMMAIDEPAPV